MGQDGPIFDYFPSHPNFTDAPLSSAKDSNPHLKISVLSSSRRTATSRDLDADSQMDGHDGDDSKQSTTDMTVFVQNLLQQMQSRFQTMSESIITKNILWTIYLFAFYPFENKLLVLHL
ncbi:hypothetical protein Droror1_Dr00014992 [Drosera rotundifolia]